MKVRELISLNAQIVDVRIDVRKNGGELVDSLHFGPDYGVVPPYPLIMHQNTSREKQATYIRKNINAWDDGREYWEVKPDRLPDKWLGLEVFSWKYSSVYRPHHQRDDLTHSMQGIEIVALPFGDSLDIKQKVDNVKQKVDGWEHLEGQMSLFDMENADE